VAVLLAMADRQNGLLARAATRRWPSALVVGLGEGETYMMLRMKRQIELCAELSK
jgi:hypothetical protein